MIGKTVGHYRITAKLGAGGMGEVFLAEDTRLERKAAIKFLPAEVADNPERRQRFLTEAKAASSLNHPHVALFMTWARRKRACCLSRWSLWKGSRSMCWLNGGRRKFRESPRSRCKWLMRWMRRTGAGLCIAISNLRISI